jgi:hypothetical protein
VTDSLCLSNSLLAVKHLVGSLLNNKGRVFQVEQLLVCLKCCLSRPPLSAGVFIQSAVNATIPARSPSKLSYVSIIHQCFLNLLLYSSTWKLKV